MECKEHEAGDHEADTGDAGYCAMHMTTGRERGRASGQAATPICAVDEAAVNSAMGTHGVECFGTKIGMGRLHMYGKKEKRRFRAPSLMLPSAISQNEQAGARRAHLAVLPPPRYVGKTLRRTRARRRRRGWSPGCSSTRAGGRWVLLLHRHQRSGANGLPLRRKFQKVAKQIGAKENMAYKTKQKDAKQSGGRKQDLPTSVPHLKWPTAVQGQDTGDQPYVQAMGRGPWRCAPCGLPNLALVEALPAVNHLSKLSIARSIYFVA